MASHIAKRFEGNQRLYYQYRTAAERQEAELAAKRQQAINSFKPPRFTNYSPNPYVRSP